MAADTESKKGNPRRSFMWQTWGIPMGLLVAPLAAALMLTAACGGGEDASEAALIAQGAVAPDFTLPAANGESVTLSDVVAEKSVLLYFSMGSG